MARHPSNTGMLASSTNTDFVAIVDGHIPSYVFNGQLHTKPFVITCSCGFTETGHSFDDVEQWYARHIR